MSTLRVREGKYVNSGSPCQVSIRLVQSGAAAAAFHRALPPPRARSTPNCARGPPRLPSHVTGHLPVPEDAVDRQKLTIFDDPPPTTTPSAPNSSASSWSHATSSAPAARSHQPPRRASLLVLQGTAKYRVKSQVRVMETVLFWNLQEKKREDFFLYFLRTIHRDDSE